MASIAYKLMYENRFIICLLNELEKKGQSEADARTAVIRLLDRNPSLKKRHSNELMEIFLSKDGVTVNHIKDAINRAVKHGSKIHPETVVDAEYKVLSWTIGEVLNQEPFITVVDNALEAIFDKEHGYTTSHRAHRLARRVFWQSLGLKVHPSGMPLTWDSSSSKKPAA